MDAINNCLEISNIGKLLQETREEQKIDLKEISSAINVRVTQLEAIEKGNMNELPGMVYAIGFVKSYASHLGLDSDEIAAAFKREHGKAEPANTEIDVEPSIKTQPAPTSNILLISGIAIIALLLLWVFVISDDNVADENLAIDNIPEPPKELIAKITDEKTISNITKDADDNTATANNINATESAITNLDNNENKPVKNNIDAPKQDLNTPKTNIQTKSPKKPIIKNNKLLSGKAFGATGGKSRISLRAIASSWVHIKDKNGKTVFRKVLRPGQIYRVPNIDGLSLTTANAGGLEVYVDGKKLDPFGKKGDIIRGIELNPNKILKKNKL